MAQTEDHKSGRDRSPQKSARPEAAEEVWLTKFRLARNAAYHDDRERHYVRGHKWMMFIVVLFGTATIGTIAKSGGDVYALFASLISTMAGVADLVFDLDGKARLHSSLKRKFYDLLARLELGATVQEIEVEMIRIYADEPPTMHAVNALAFNNAVDALGRPPDQKYELELRHRFLRHVWPFRANEFPERSAH